MKISLIINTYNRMHTLPVTLHALEFLRYKNFEVIVVDGPSDDGTLAYLKSHWKDKIKICICDEANLSKSRNIGIQNASGEIVCFTDDDGIPEPDWLDQLVVAYKDPQVAAVGGWVRNHTGVEYQTKYMISCRGPISETLIEDSHLVPESKPLSYKFPGLIGVNSSFRKLALLEIGGFDEEYAYFLDETDVLARLVDAGHIIKMMPNAEVHHKYAKSHIRSQNGAPKSWFQVTKSAAYYIIKNATPDMSLIRCMELIISFNNHLIDRTKQLLSENVVTKSQCNQLLTEIHQGATLGISDAFKYPIRNLMGTTYQKPRWKPFPSKMDSTSRLRLAFVTAFYPPRPCGGVAVFINSLAKRLAELGHEITVITQAEPGREHTVDFEDGVWVHRLSNNDNAHAELPPSMPDMPFHLKDLAGRILTEINRVNDRRQFQAIIGTIWDVDLAAVIASKAYKTAMYMVTSYKLMEESKPKWKKKRSLYNNHIKKMIDAEIWALKNADLILASTNAIRCDMETSYGFKIDTNKLKLLPFGVPNKVITNNQLAKERVDLLFVGRFEYRKGIDLLLEILPRLLEKHQNLYVTCIGDNTIKNEDGKSYLKKFLKQFASAPWLNRVIFPGHVDDATLEAAYANCDFFVAPSRYESFGLIYLEAMRFGKACIGTTAGGIPEVIAKDKTGLLVPPNNATELYKAIETLILNKNLRENLGKAGLQLYQEKFTTNSFAANFETLMRNWLNSQTSTTS